MRFFPNLLTAIIGLLFASPLQGQTPDELDANATGTVRTLALQADGRILMAGNFVFVDGVARNYIARLHADGTLDKSFNPNANSSVTSLAVQADGKILITGNFTTVGGVTRNYIARLNADGTLDASFNPDANSAVYALAVQADGRILIGGVFTSVGGVALNHIARLNADGTLDTSFNPNANSTLRSITLQADGKILIGGFFTTVGGLARNRIARLNAGGTLDTSFNPNASSTVTSLAVQTDGRILMGGPFTSVGGVTRNRIARLSADGMLDTSFNPNASSDVNSVAIHTDGKILVGGQFTSVGGVVRNRIARLNADGTLDMSFDPDAGSDVSFIAVQADGKILMGGNFTTVGGVERNRIARLANNIAATQTLVVTGTHQIDWSRGGASPEVGQVTFESWNGNAWASEGNATRVPGGWRKTGLSLPASGWIRARGETSAGYYNGSSGMVEQVVRYGAGALPDIVVRTGGNLIQQSGFHTQDFGTVDGTTAVSPVTFTITNVGDAALTGLSLSLDGLHAGDFILSSLEATSLAPGASTEFTVSFSQKGVGNRSARLLISNNDGGESPFLILLNGTSIHTELSFNTNLFNSARSLAVQADGKILAGGSTSIINGISQNAIARLNTDGTLDKSFNANGVLGGVDSIAVQGDGRILLGGWLATVDGGAANGLVRLNSDGTPDRFFNPSVSSSVYSLAVQADGSILIAGDFTTVGGMTRNRIARLHADGTLDTSFNPNANELVQSLAVQPDGKILMGGWFTTVGGVARNCFARLNANGTLDPSFNPNADSGVYSIATQVDGGILIGGYFTTVGGVARNRIARLNPDGSLDMSFNPNADRAVFTLALQADGSILIGGEFYSVGGVTRNRIARLNADGTLDMSFNSDANNSVSSLILLADGKILMGGGFSSVDGLERRFIARLTNNIAASQTLAVTGTTQIDWSRGGSAPEIEQVTFDSWNGSTWVSEGNATRVTGGWRKTGLSLPASGWIRARGRASGGDLGGGSGIVEQIASYGSPANPDLVVEVDDSIPLASEDAQVDFGTIEWPAASAPRTFTLTNRGTATLNGLSIGLSGSNAADFSTSVLGTTSLEPGDSTSFSITFMPQGRGDRGTSLWIVSNDPDKSRFEITLRGVSLHQDPTFNPNANQTVNTLALQADGKILMGGWFTSVGGVARSRIARLNADDTLDMSFNPNVNSSVNSLVVQASGKILIGGDFTTVGGVARNRIARLNSDGTLDTSFNPNASSSVNSIAIQADGKILMGGSFTTVGGVTRNCIARLNADGTLDTSFDPNSSSSVYSIAIQADGKILMGGLFTTVRGVARNCIARLNADGTMDTSFNPNANSYVGSLVLQANGKILIGGNFTTVGGLTRNRVARLHSDGTLDTSFNPNAGDIVNSLTVQADGKILLGGDFTTVGGLTRNRLARLNSDGTLDTSFDPDASSKVNSLALQADGKILMGGYFTTVGGVERNCIARLTNNIAATQTLAVTGLTQIDWSRGGSAPEVGQVMFESWNGSTWVSGGSATRVSGGWRRTGLELPADGWIRTRGSTSGGYFNGSAGIVEQIESYGSPSSPDLVVEVDDSGPLAIGVAKVDFGTIDWPTASAPRTFTLINRGTATLNGLSIGFSGSNAADFSTSALGTTSLEPGGSTSFSISFKPQGSGDRGALLWIVSNDPDKSRFEIALRGMSLQQDPTFNPNANGSILSIAAQANGGILIGGDFTTIGGVTRNRIARLNSDGTLDTSFNPNVNGTIHSLAVQADGKILIGGNLTTVGGVARNCIARLNSDGTLDTFFNPNASFTVYSIVVQAEGEILIGGNFTTVGGMGRNRIARLHADGTLDIYFNPSANGLVHSIGVQADGKILIGGTFTALGAVTSIGIARLYGNGTLDTSFNQNASGYVYSLAVQPDGKILMGGSFSKVGGVVRNRIARLNGDGMLDTSFNPNASDTVHSLVLQADGRMLIAGNFTTVGGVMRNYIARLNADGTMDLSFDPNAGSNVNSIALQTDGKILIGGTFTTVGGVARNRIARLVNNIAATQTLAVTGINQIDWSRGGSSPEVGQVTFENWNSSAWVSIGNVTRVSGDWRRTGLSLPTSGWIRARGRTSGGYYNGSSGMVEQVVSYGGGAFPDIAVEEATAGNLVSGLNGLDFGSCGVGYETEKILTIRNRGSAVLSDIALNITGPGFAITTPPTTTIAPGEAISCTLTLAPVLAGNTTGLLSISSNDLDETPFRVPLSGSAYLPSEIAVEQPIGSDLASGAVSDFGLVRTGQSRPRVFTIRNTAGGTMNLGALAISGAHVADFVLVTAGTMPTLGPTSSTTVLVFFQPLSGGAKTATLTIPNSDPDENPFTLNLTGFSNSPPTFTGYAVSTSFQTPASISLTKLLAGTSDPEGDSFSVTAAGPASTQSGSAVLRIGSILYTPPAGFIGTDTFAVTVSDEHGAATVANVTVTVRSPFGTGINPPQIVSLPNGDKQIRFQAIPGRIYRILRSTNMSDWTTIASPTAGPTGGIEFIDEDPPQPNAFYRLAFP